MDNAKRTLIYYFRTVFNAAGLTWTSDNTAEVEDIVDSIFEDIRPCVHNIKADKYCVDCSKLAKKLGSTNIPSKRKFK